MAYVVIACDCGAELLDYRDRLRGKCDKCADDGGAPLYGISVKLGWGEYLPDPRDTPAAKKSPDEEDVTDRITKRLMDDALKTHGSEVCPKCGLLGRFIRMAIVCDLHGPFGGC